MQDDQLDDLKQFIDSKISQSEERLRSEISELREETRESFYNRLMGSRVNCQRWGRFLAIATKSLRLELLITSCW